MIINERKKYADELLKTVNDFKWNTNPGPEESKELQEIINLLQKNTSNKENSLAGKKLKKFIDKKINGTDWKDKNKYCDDLKNSYKKVFENIPEKPSSAESDIEQLAKDAKKNIQDNKLDNAKNKYSEILNKTSDENIKKSVNKVVDLINNKEPKNESILDLFRNRIILESEKDQDLIKAADDAIKAIKSSIHNKGATSKWDYSPLISLKKDFNIIQNLSSKALVIGQILRQINSTDGNETVLSQKDFEKTLKDALSRNPSVKQEDVAYACVLLELSKSSPSWFRQDGCLKVIPSSSCPYTEINEDKEAFSFFYKENSRNNQTEYIPNDKGEELNKVIQNFGFEKINLSSSISRYFENYDTAKDFINKILKGENTGAFKKPSKSEEFASKAKENEEDIKNTLKDVVGGNGGDDIRKEYNGLSKTASQKIGVDSTEIDFSKGFFGFDVKVPNLSNIKDFDYAEFSQELRKDFEKKLKEKIEKLNNMEVIQKKPKEHKFDKLDESISRYIIINEEDMKNQNVLDQALNDFDNVFDQCRGKLSKLQSKLKTAGSYNKSIDISSKLRNEYIDYVSNIAKIYKGYVASLAVAANKQEKINNKNKEKEEKDPVKAELKKNKEEYKTEHNKNALINILSKPADSDVKKLARLIFTALLQKESFEVFKKLSKGSIEAANVVSSSSGNNGIRVGTSNVFYITTGKEKPKSNINFRFIDNKGEERQTQAIDLLDVKSHQYKNINTIFRDGGIDTSLFEFGALNEFRKQPIYKEMLSNLATYNKVRDAIQDQLTKKPIHEGLVRGVSNIVDRFTSNKERSTPININMPVAGETGSITNPMDYIKNNSIKLDLGAISSLSGDGNISFNGDGYDDLALRQTVGNCIAIRDGATKSYFLVSQEVFNKSQEILKQAQKKQEQYIANNNKRDDAIAKQGGTSHQETTQDGKTINVPNVDYQADTSVVTSAAANSMVHDGYNYRKQKLKKLIRRF